MGRKIAHYIPEDAKAVNRANNHGVPVMIEAPSAKVVQEPDPTSPDRRRPPQGVTYCSSSGPWISPTRSIALGRTRR